ncbi:MAG: YncE family protein [Candidatus Limnocylindrales bacterium]
MVRRVPLPSTPLGPLWITVADGAPWIALGGDPQGTVERIDPESGRITDRVRVGWAPGSIAASGTSLWVSNTDGDGSLPHSPYLNTVQRIDTTTGRILQTVPVVLPGRIVADASGAWVISARHTLVHVSLAGQIAGSVALAAGPPTLDLPVSIALAGGRIWIALARGGFGSVTLEAIDPATLRSCSWSISPRASDGWSRPRPPSTVPS